MEFLIKNKWWILIGILLIWVTFPFLFKGLMTLMGIKLGALNDYGAIGDIYGSLNTLFTSATLIIVMYSAYLQRQANQDTRVAMEEQIKESRNAVFSNMFYNLLEHSSNRINALTIRNDNSVLTKHEILNLMSEEFSRLLKEEWKNNMQDVTKGTVRKALKSFVDKISDGQRSTGLYSSFYNYKTLIFYVKKEKKEQAEREFYFQIIRNSMPYVQKKALLWLAINDRNDEYLECLKDTYILDLKLDQLSRENNEEREARELLLKFIKHFEIHPTLFRSHPDQTNK